MKVMTEITYEKLREALGLADGLKIEVAEVDVTREVVNIVVSGDLPNRAVTGAGFYPSPKRSGSFPDFVRLDHLQKED